MNYKIFGFVYNFKIENRSIESTLTKELNLYEKTEEKSEIDVLIINNIKRKEGLNNPIIHETTQNSFFAKMGNMALEFYFFKKKLAKIKLEILPSKSLFDKKIRKFKSRQYASLEESIGQTVHELILVPTIFFDEKKVLVHSSAFCAPNGQTFMLGGTGGVGKTSLELEFCLNENFTFLADDISILGNTGYIYPNLSFPKIYGYNLVGNEKLKKIIFQNQSFFDKFHWIFKSRKGLDKVRRRVSPQELYENFSNKPQKTNKYFILSKERCDKVSIKRIAPTEAAQMTYLIILNEYQALNQHLIWNEYNSILSENSAFISQNNLREKSLKIYNTIFSQMECFKISIPKSIPHYHFIKETKKIILSHL
jgi:hypothetical protein